MIDAAPPKHIVTRIRRETKRRFIRVAAKEELGPRMLRIRFASDDLVGFDSAAPDDHIKLFIPSLAPIDDGEPADLARDYTPRSFDAVGGTLTIDFVLHDAGPATQWARRAAVGDQLQIGGPRGSTVVADDFDWYLLIGDETAFPAISRRLEELRRDALKSVLILVDTEADILRLPDASNLTARWVARTEFDGDDAALLLRALEDLSFPQGDGYVWIAAEALVARALRSVVVEERGHPREWTKASGYWSRSAAGAHETIKD